MKGQRVLVAGLLNIDGYRVKDHQLQQQIHSLVFHELQDEERCGGSDGLRYNGFLTYRGHDCPEKACKSDLKHENSLIFALFDDL